MQRNSKVVPYLDIPIQHISTPVLKRMRRPETGDEIRSLMRTLRAAVPGLTLRPTMMIGVPGETEEEFGELCHYVEEAAFDWMGSFVFEPQEGTKAFDMPEQIDEATGKKRQDRLMAAQHRITRQRNRERIGSVYPVLITGKMDSRLFVGHAVFQAPEADGVTLVQSEEKLKPGTIVPVKMKAVRDYDMLGEVQP